jgi:serine protease inhibitor
MNAGTIPFSATYRKQTLHLSSQTKLKLFVFNDLGEAEKEINQWLQENRFEIKEIVQSQSERNGRFVFVTSIYYQPMEIPD